MKCYTRILRVVGSNKVFHDALSEFYSTTFLETILNWKKKTSAVWSLEKDPTSILKCSLHSDFFTWPGSQLWLHMLLAWRNETLCFMKAEDEEAHE